MEKAMKNVYKVDVEYSNLAVNRVFLVRAGSCADAARKGKWIARRESEDDGRATVVGVDFIGRLSN